MPLFGKKKEGKPVVGELNSPPNFSNTGGPTLSDLDEPPKPLFDQHKATLHTPTAFEKQMNDKLVLPGQFDSSAKKQPMFSFEDPKVSFPAPSEEGKVDDVPLNFDALLEKNKKQHEQEEEHIKLEPLSVQPKKIEEPIMQQPQQPLKKHFIPLTALKNAEEIIYALQHDLDISNDTLYRVDDLNKKQLLLLEKWHLDLEYTDAIITKIDEILFKE